MSLESVMPIVMQWGSATEALAALGAALAVRQPGVDAPPEIVAALDEVSSAAGIGNVAELPAPQRAMVLGLIRLYLHEAKELLEHPGQPPAWTVTDPVVLDGWGRGSSMVPPIIAASHPDLAEVSSFLDVGTGVGLLAVAATNVWPSASVVGIDTWEPSLERARANVADAGLGDRITLRSQDFGALDDVDAFDCAWIPSFFLPEADLAKGLEGTVRALRPGGWIALGRMRSSPDPVADATSKFRTLRSGGCSVTTARAVELLEQAGCVSTHAAQPVGPAPVELVLGQRPAG